MRYTKLYQAMEHYLNLSPIICDSDVAESTPTKYSSFTSLVSRPAPVHMWPKYNLHCNLFNKVHVPPIKILKLVRDEPKNLNNAWCGCPLRSWTPLNYQVYGVNLRFNGLMVERLLGIIDLSGNHNRWLSNNYIPVPSCGGATETKHAEATTQGTLQGPLHVCRTGPESTVSRCF